MHIECNFHAPVAPFHQVPHAGWLGRESTESTPRLNLDVQDLQGLPASFQGI